MATRSNVSAIENGDYNTETNEGESWFVRGARQAGLCVRDGRVYAQTDGYMFEVPAPQSCEDAAAFLAYSLVKHAEYRIGQNQGGDLNAETSKFVADLGSFKPARNADAAEAVYLTAIENTVRDLIVDDSGNNVGDDVKIADTYLLPVKDDGGNTRLQVVSKGTANAIRMQAAIDSVAKDNRGSFDRAVDAAIERGRNKPTKEKAAGPGRGRRSNATSLGITL